jgi:hypothetical protein
MAVASQPRGPVAHILFFWRPGDAAWSGLSVAPTAEIHSVEFHAGKIYCIDKRFSITIYDLKLGTTSPPEFLQVTGMAADGFCKSSESLWADRRLDHLTLSVRAVHVVACGGQLLLVLLLFHGRQGLFMEVYRPAWTPRWPFRVGERVTDLGGYAIFLGRGDAVTLSAKEYPAIRDNCVYYLIHCPNMHMKHWATMFDLGTDAVEDIPYPEKENGSDNWWPYSWFCPRRPLLEKQLD